MTDEFKVWTDGGQPQDDTEHAVTVESTQVYRGEVTPERAEFLTNDGQRFDRLIGKQRQGEGVELEIHKEIKRTYECSCGRRFRKPETAREHLEEQRNDRSVDSATGREGPR